MPARLKFRITYFTIKTGLLVSDTNSHLLLIYIFSSGYIVILSDNYMINEYGITRKKIINIVLYSNRRIIFNLIIKINYVL